MTVEQITSYLTLRYTPKAILLHGSRVTEDHGPNSDYDLALITDHPEKVCPHSYQGMSLDLSPLSPSTSVLKTGDTPVWPIEILFDDADKLGLKIAEQTHQLFLKGPSPLSSQDWENRKNYCNRLMGRIIDRGNDPLIRPYYIGDFFSRSVRYWFEKHVLWTRSIHCALPLIKDKDPDFYTNLQGLWGEDYIAAAIAIRERIFGNINQIS